MQLTTVNNGDLVQKFNEALPQIMANITNENTDPKATREIILKIRFKPDEDRDQVAVTTFCHLKLAPDPGESVLFLDEIEGDEEETFEG